MGGHHLIGRFEDEREAAIAYDRVARASFGAEAQLNLANGRFADGDLRGSLEALTEAQRIVASAETGGIVRIASAILVVILVLALAVLLARRRTSYTAAP